MSTTSTTPRPKTFRGFVGASYRLAVREYQGDAVGAGSREEYETDLAGPLAYAWAQGFTPAQFHDGFVK